MIPQQVNAAEPSLLESQTIRAAAAIAYIYADYLKTHPSETKLLLTPPKGDFFEDSIEFYKKNLEASQNLLTWFKENVDPIQKWLQRTKKWYEITTTDASFQARRDNYLERWKEVAKKEIKSQLTVENIIELGGAGKASRIFNKNPMEEVLCPHEIRGIIDDFLPDATKKGDAEAASHQTLRKLAGALQTRFIDSEILDEIIDEYKQSNPDGFENLLLAAYVNPAPKPITKEPTESDEIYQERLNEYQKKQEEYDRAAKNLVDNANKYAEILKKDLMSSVLQPLGNYIDAGENGEKKAGKQIAYNAVFKSTLQLNLEQQLRGGEALTVEGGNYILEGKELLQLGRETKGQDKIDKGKSLLEKKEELIANGSLTEQGRTLKESITQIQQHPERFEFVGSEETTKKDYIQVLFDHNQILELPQAFLEKPKKTSTLNTILQSIGSTMNSLLSGLKSFFSSSNEQKNNPEVTEKEVVIVEARKIPEEDAIEIESVLAQPVVEEPARASAISTEEAEGITVAEASEVSRRTFKVPTKPHENDAQLKTLSEVRHSEPVIAFVDETQKTHTETQEANVTTRHTH